MAVLTAPAPSLFALDFSNVDWTQLTSPQAFVWQIGRTPFSQIQVPLFLTLGYFLSVFALQRFMRDRKPLELIALNRVHNAILCLLSTAMFLGACYGAYLKYHSQGVWAGWVCEQETSPMHGPLFYWSFIFYLSKFYEFLDTYFLVLKKKPLIFLHVWHHCVMPWVCWAGLEGKWAMALWTSLFWNSFVHIFMYFYYFVSSFGYQPWWKKYLTMLQIYQFVSGVVYTGVYFYYYFGGLRFANGAVTYTQGCTGELWAISSMFFVNCSFLVLFGQFFRTTYTPRKTSLGLESQRKPQPPKVHEH